MKTWPEKGTRLKDNLLLLNVSNGYIYFLFGYCNSYYNKCPLPYTADSILQFYHTVRLISLTLITRNVRTVHRPMSLHYRSDYLFPRADD